MTTDSDLHQPSVRMQPFGLRVFDRLEARSEQPWLEQVYVPPASFEVMAGDGSIIVSGKAGSGKTALRLALAQAAASAVSEATLEGARFVVTWHPSPIRQSQREVALAANLVQVFDACAEAVLSFIVLNPRDFQHAPDWVQTILRWFVRCHLIGDPHLRVAELLSYDRADTRDLLDHVITGELIEVLPAESPEPLIINRLVSAMRRLGFRGVWLCVDGLDAWVDANLDLQQDMLQALLGSLGLLEENGFALKLFVPDALEPRIGEASSIVRRRLRHFPLAWDDDRLTEIVERRMALALGVPRFSLDDLCTASAEKSNSLKEKWVKRYGGITPRGWLQQISPLLHAYLDQRRAAPFDEVEWPDIAWQYPPSLHIDFVSRRVFIGQGEIEEVTGNAFKLLSYLHQNRHKICTKSELHYSALNGKVKIPAQGEDGYEDPKNYEGRIDSEIERLRKKVEPVKGKPIYVVTFRNKGVQLQHGA